MGHLKTVSIRKLAVKRKIILLSLVLLWIPFACVQAQAKGPDASVQTPDIVDRLRDFELSILTKPAEFCPGPDGKNMIFVSRDHFLKMILKFSKAVPTEIQPGNFIARIANLKTPITFIKKSTADEFVTSEVKLDFVQPGLEIGPAGISIYYLDRSGETFLGKKGLLTIDTIPPPIPVNIKVTSSSHNNFMVTWDMDKKPGLGEIKEYIIQKLEHGDWKTVKRGFTTASVSIDSVPEGRFRILAVDCALNRVQTEFLPQIHLTGEFQPQLHHVIHSTTLRIPPGKKISVQPIASSGDEFTDLSIWFCDQIETVLIKNPSIKLVSERYITQLLAQKDGGIIDIGKVMLKLKADYSFCGTYYETAKLIEVSLELYDLTDFNVVAKENFRFVKRPNYELKIAKIRGYLKKSGQANLLSLKGGNKDLRVSLKMDRTSYKVGDNDGVLTIKSNFDCYINVFSISADGAVGRVFPKNSASNFIRKNQVREIPNFRFFLPQGFDSARERVKVIASKEDISFKRFLTPINKSFSKVDTPSINALIEELETLPPAIWTEANVSYWIER